MSAGRLVAYFGYGSLVNRATLRTAIVDAVPARLLGWRRHWRPRPDMPGFPAALLTVRREAGAGCDGLLVIDRMENLAAVDEREARYRRVELAAAELAVAGARPDWLAPGCPAYVYVADPDIPVHPEPPRILRSYLDAVMQGFLVEHGEAGLRRFLAETHGFETAIHEDRATPAYPRAVALTPGEIALFATAMADAAASGAWGVPPLRPPPRARF